MATTHKMIKQGIVVSDKNDKTIVVAWNVVYPSFIQKDRAAIKNLWLTMKITLRTRVILFKLWNPVR